MISQSRYSHRRLRDALAALTIVNRVPAENCGQLREMRYRYRAQGKTKAAACRLARGMRKTWYLGRRRGKRKWSKYCRKAGCRLLCRACQLSS